MLVYFTKGFLMDYKFLRFCTVFLSIMFTLSSYGSDYKFYVAIDGNDNWSGAIAEKSDADGPFATIGRAKDAVRELIKSGKADGTITVYVRGGMYFLDKPLIFTPEDTGTVKTPIKYISYNNEISIISGGKAITGFKQNGKLWSVEIPEVKSGEWLFYQLFVNEKRRVNARMPNEGYLRTVETLEKGFDFRTGDIRRWDNIEDARITLFHLWESSTHYIESIDDNKSYVELDTGIPWGGMCWIEKEQRYIIENVFEGLDQPGEWYLNRKSGTLYYYPMAEEKLENVQVIAPILPVTLIDFQGDPENEKFISYISFNGINFAHSDARLAKGQIPQVLQAAFKQNAAIMAKGLRNSSFENCRVEHLGEHGIWLGSGCQNNQIVKCSIGDLGAGGIRLGEDSLGTRDANSTGHNTIDNCIIYDGGNFFHGAVGVWIGKSSYNQITHNDVFDFDQTGISVGWQWGYQPSTANNNKIEYNHVHHIGHGVLSDMGAIYLLGISPGTTVKNNLVHDVVGYPSYWNGLLPDGQGDMPASGNGIYPDEGCSDVIFENNIVYRVKGTCFSVNYCRKNIVRNNIFAFGQRALGINHGDTQVNMMDITNNIMICNGSAMLLGHWGNAKFTINKNIYWTTNNLDKVLFSGKTFDKWQEMGNDKDSLMIDPGFKNPAMGDFSLDDNSLAFKMGFKPINTKNIGVYGDPNWILTASNIKPRVNAPEPPVRQPEAIHADFERSQSLLQAYVFCQDSRVTSENPASITITNEKAVSGKQSVKVVDVSGFSKSFSGEVNNFYPYFYYEPNYKRGAVKFSCSIFNDKQKPAEILIQMRDWSENPTFFQEEKHPGIGPSLKMLPNGDVMAGGSKIAELPLGEWIKLTITLDIDSNSKEYEIVTETQPGNVQRFKAPLLSEKFKILNWLGFSSSGNHDSVFYIDNIQLKGE